MCVRVSCLSVSCGANQFPTLVIWQGTAGSGQGRQWFTRNKPVAGSQRNRRQWVGCVKATLASGSRRRWHFAFGRNKVGMENPWKIVSVRDVSENRLDPWADLDKIAWSVDGHLAPPFSISPTPSLSHVILRVAIRCRYEGSRHKSWGGNIRQSKGTIGTGEGRQGER